MTTHITLLLVALFSLYVCCYAHDDDAQPEWEEQQQGDNIPSPRFDFSYAYSTATNRFYVFGGQTNNGSVGDFHAYDLRSKTWNTLPVGPSPRRDAGATICFGKFYIFGGNNATHVHNDMWEYDEETNRWYFINTFSGMQLTAGSLVCGQRLVYVGGMTLNQTYSSLTHVYDEVARTWRVSSTSGPNGRIWSPMAWAPKPYNQSFLFGGYAGSFPQYDDFWTLSGQGAGWARIENEDMWPSARSGHCTVWLEKQKSFVVFGGENDDGQTLHDLWYYHIESRMWTSLSLFKSPPKRLGAGAVAVGKNILLFGGITGFGNNDKILNDLWMLSGGDSQRRGVPFLLLLVLCFVLS